VTFWLRIVSFNLPEKIFNEQEYLIISNALEKSTNESIIASDAHTLCIVQTVLKSKNDVHSTTYTKVILAGYVFIGGKGVKIIG